MASTGRTIITILLVLVALLFGIPSLLILIFGGFGLFKIIPIAILGIITWGLVKLFSKKEDKKDYKAEKTTPPMKIQSIFYLVGVVFIFASVWYFAREYIAQFPRIVKLILLIVSTIVIFIIAEFMRGADK